MGVEMLHVSRRDGKGDMRRLLFETLGAAGPEVMTVRETPPPYGKKIG